MDSGDGVGAGDQQEGEDGEEQISFAAICAFQVRSHEATKVERSEESGTKAATGGLLYVVWKRPNKRRGQRRQGMATSMAKLLR